MKDLNKYKSDLDEIEAYIDRVIYQCLTQSNSGIVNFLNSAGTHHYSLIMRHVDRDDNDLKLLAQEIFNCLGSPVTDINNTVLDLDVVLARMCELKKKIEKLKKRKLRTCK